MKGYVKYARYNEELGRYEYNQSVYAQFFAQNIQSYLILEDGTKYYAYPYLKYAKLRDNDSETTLNNIKRIFPDEQLAGIQNELEEKIGIQVDMINFYVLCDFVNEVVREQYFILLKPTVKDIVAEIKEAKELAITNTDGSNVSITNSKMIEVAIKAMKECEYDSKLYEADKIVKLDGFANNIVIQSRFAYYVAATLKEFFPNAKRRKNCCMVSEVEQRLIMRMLSYFKLAPEDVTLTTSRFRQLIGFYKQTKIDNDITNLPLTKLPDEIGYFPIFCVKYEDWDRNNIDWQNPKLQLHPLKNDDIVTFEDCTLNC